MTFSPTGSLICSSPSNRRQLINDQQIDSNDNAEDNPLQLAKADDGKYYPLGSRGPCQSMASFFADNNRRELLFGYDVFQLKPVCVDVSPFDSPYFNPTEEHQRFENALNRPTTLMTRLPTTLLFQKNQHKIDFLSNKKFGGNNGKRRQGDLTSGVFQVPGSLPDPLLNPCRPGAKNDNNFKCTDPHV